MSDLVNLLNNETADLVDQVTRSLVTVRNLDSGAGSGVILHEQGLIVTNAHVAGQGRIQVELDDGTEVPARVLAVDPDHDLVALSVEADDLPAIELGDSAWLQPGDWVLALGHPWGVPGAATTGTVIGTDDDLPEMSRGRREWIAVGMRLRPGNSGGPLVDSRGRLVGINTMITGPNVGMAVPVNTVKRFLRQFLGSRESVAAAA